MNQPIVIPDEFSCLRVRLSDNEKPVCEIDKANIAEWDTDGVTIKVCYSSLNYKDALCASGHPGVARSLPLVPGIDAAGVVVESKSEQFQPGDEVMVFNEKLGTASNGAYSEFIRVDPGWVYSIPNGLSMRQVMTIGTAGFTAAQCAAELQRHDISPGSGPIVVTGATGGVGIFAVKLLAKLGFDVVASTGKPDRVEWLKANGANEVITRQEIDDETDVPLLKSRYAGAVDTVGGNTLATVIRSTKRFGCVTACGVVAGPDLPLTVYPFILRGVTLQGVDTAGITRGRRAGIWDRLAQDWSIDDVDELAIEVDFEGLQEQIQNILKGQVAGRVVVKIGD